jgi:hypothetical protein
MPSAKGKKPYLQAIWRLPTVPAVETAGGGAGGGRAVGGRAGPAAGAAAASATGGRRGDRTSSGEGRAEASDMFVDQQIQSEVLAIGKQRSLGHVIYF